LFWCTSFFYHQTHTYKVDVSHFRGWTIKNSFIKEQRKDPCQTRLKQSVPFTKGPQILQIVLSPRFADLRFAELFCGPPTKVARSIRTDVKLKMLQASLDRRDINTVLQNYTAKATVATFHRCFLPLHTECWTNSVLSLYLPFFMIIDQPTLNTRIMKSTSVLLFPLTRATDPQKQKIYFTKSKNPCSSTASIFLSHIIIGVGTPARVYPLFCVFVHCWHIS
jgi:hypothetical protein